MTDDETDSRTNRVTPPDATPGRKSGEDLVEKPGRADDYIVDCSDGMRVKWCAVELYCEQARWLDQLEAAFRGGWQPVDGDDTAEELQQLRRRIIRSQLAINAVLHLLWDELIPVSNGASSGLEEPRRAAVDGVQELHRLSRP